MGKHQKVASTGQGKYAKVRLNNESASSVKIKREVGFSWVLLIAVLLLLAPALDSAAQDSDTDNGPSIAEGAPSGPPGGGAEAFERDDTDGDGRVSEDEFSGPPEHFDDIDQNQDGYIDRDEKPERQGPPGGGNGGEGPQGPPGGGNGPTN